MPSVFSHKHDLTKKRKTNNESDLYDRFESSQMGYVPAHFDDKDDDLIEIVVKSWEPGIGIAGVDKIFKRLLMRPQTSPRCKTYRNDHNSLQRLYEIFVIATEINSVRTQKISEQCFNGIQLLPTLEFFLLAKYPLFDPRIILCTSSFKKPNFEFPFMKKMKGRYDMGDNSVISIVANGKCLIENSKSAATFDSEQIFKIAEEYHSPTEKKHRIFRKVVRVGEDDWDKCILHAVAAIYLCRECSKHILYQWSKLHYDQKKDCQRWTEILHIALGSVNEPVGRVFMEKHIGASQADLYVIPSEWEIDGNEDVKEFFNLPESPNSTTVNHQFFEKDTTLREKSTIEINNDTLYHEDLSANDDAFSTVGKNTQHGSQALSSSYIYISDIDNNSLLSSYSCNPDNLQTQENRNDIEKTTTSQPCSSHFAIEDINKTDELNFSALSNFTNDSKFSVSTFLDSLNEMEKIFKKTSKLLETRLDVETASEVARKLNYDNIATLNKIFEVTSENLKEFLKQ